MLPILSTFYLFTAMTQISSTRQPHRGRILPRVTIPSEEMQRRKHQRDEIGKLCRVIFERIRPELIENYYNWFILIDADSENYLLDRQLKNLLEKVRDNYTNPDAKLTIFRLNENGACGKI
jgi:hypothetical protein